MIDLKSLFERIYARGFDAADARSSSSARITSPARIQMSILCFALGERPIITSKTIHNMKNAAAILYFSRWTTQRAELPQPLTARQVKRRYGSFQSVG
jgi:hypothetical protein